MPGVSASAGAAEVFAAPAGRVQEARAAPFRQVWSTPLGGGGRVDVWFVPADRDLARHACVLDRDDWSAIARLRDPKARERVRAARIALRLALSQAVDNSVQPRAWRFRTTAYGKPQVAAGLPQVHFSVSHIETASVIAVSTVPVGIDIETIARPVDERIVEAVCSPRERRSLAKLDVRARQREFARLWALKEAYAKLTGTGLAADFRFLDFSQAQHTPGVAGMRSWTTEAPGDLCQVAVVVEESEAAADTGELVCFAVADDVRAAVDPKTLSPGAEQFSPALS